MGLFYIAKHPTCGWGGCGYSNDDMTNPRADYLEYRG